MADFAIEGGHWYKSDGTPFYTMLGKNGKERSVTLRDVKKLGNLYPSVTMIIGLAAKPGLDIWKQYQTILACLTMPKIDGESESDYITRLKTDSKSHAEQAAMKGTEIHGYIEKGFRGDLVESNKYFESVSETIVKECGLQDWASEKSFASSLGYGGKIDLHNDKYLIDFKTIEKNIETLKIQEEQKMQLSAYNNGLITANVNEMWLWKISAYDITANRKCGICYVHRETTESKLLWINEKELVKGWRCFLALLEFFYAKTGLERNHQPMEAKL